MTEFLIRNGVDVDWTLKQYWKEVGRRFIVVDASAKGFLWPKYTWREKQWGSYLDRRVMKEITHLEWLGMTRGRLPLDTDEIVCDMAIW